MIAQWRALAADPSDRRTWIDTAETLAAAGRGDASRAVLASVLERWPDSADAWIAASFGGRREAAEAAMLRATALAPTNGAAWRRLGEVIRAWMTFEGRDPVRSLDDLSLFSDPFRAEPAVRAAILGTAP